MSAAEQLPLLPSIREPTVPTRASELDEQARAFLRDCPEFWRLFVAYTQELLDAGIRRYSADAVVHRIRWHDAIRGGETFKCNNNWVACFARIYQATYPEHAHLFRTRERRSAERRARG